MELIKIENNLPVLDNDTAYQIAEFERQIKLLEEQEKKLKQAILDEMEAKGFIKVETDAIAITYVAATDREKFDSKRFREEHADLYDEYVSMTQVKPSIRIKLKERKKP